MRTVAFDGTSLQLPDRVPVTDRFPKRSGPEREFGYPLLRLVTLVETGTRAVMAAAFGPGVWAAGCGCAASRLLTSTTHPAGLGFSLPRPVLSVGTVFLLLRAIWAGQRVP
ncbi:hypothetical protein [Streptomyces sp. NPDC058066]|uniref:hypothetical protein n=1 Tax=Streptomyces sp. NPDC058066 TaxID=3346323 RepID=UPI0036E8C51F